MTQGAATVVRGKKLSVDLRTEVLFAFDKAVLTPKATTSLDLAAKTLKEQPGRRLAVVGHTDSQGSDGSNLTLSRQRAEAVRQALAQRLGSGWTFTVQGKGESDPAIPEKGLSGADLKAAQAANRRVSVEVAP